MSGNSLRLGEKCVHDPRPPGCVEVGRNGDGNSNTNSKECEGKEKFLFNNHSGTMSPYVYKFSIEYKLQYGYKDKSQPFK